MAKQKSTARRLTVTLSDEHWKIIDMIVEQAGAGSVDNLVADMFERACQQTEEMVVEMRQDPHSDT